MVLEAVEHNLLSLDYASPELKTDRELMLGAVEQNGNPLSTRRQRPGGP